MFKNEKNILEEAWEKRELLASEEVRDAIRRVVEAVDKGKLRCAEPIDLERSEWQVNEWVKRRLLCTSPFRLCAQ